MKPIRAWAVASPDDEGGLVPYGNQHEWQYPVFYTKRELLAWKRRVIVLNRSRIVRVEIREVPRGGRKVR